MPTPIYYCGCNLTVSWAAASLLPAECTPLFQLIKLINAMRRDPTDTILETIAQNNQSYCQLSYNIKKICLDTYDTICRIRRCFVCKL